VVVEGANLAVTQRARISYSRRGGRVNADFVDNAAGVALSDPRGHLKVLLNLAQGYGRLDAAMRSEMLSEVTDESRPGSADRCFRGSVDPSITPRSPAHPTFLRTKP